MSAIGELDDRKMTDSPFQRKFKNRKYIKITDVCLLSWLLGRQYIDMILKHQLSILNSRSSLGASTNSQASRPNYGDLLENVDDEIFDMILGEDEMKLINKDDPDQVD